MRPQPPELAPGEFRPALEVGRWIVDTFLDPSGSLVNEDHEHLQQASLGVLWTAVENSRHGMTVVGTAEIPNFRGNAWQKERQSYQLVQWFGSMPDFLITLSADYAATVDDVSFCALVEHELYHCAQATDRWGAPRFHQFTGEPLWSLRGHDVEEFVGIVERYGAGAGAGKTESLVRAAQRKPTVAAAQISAACGTCNRRAA